MTAPYRLRAAAEDNAAADYLFATIMSAAILGLTPSITTAWGLSLALTVGFVAFWTGVLLLCMFLTDRRLRKLPACVEAGA